MPKLRRLSGAEVIKILNRFGFAVTLNVAATPSFGESFPMVPFKR